MYSTCLHCTKSLGTNDVLETLPIGRRIAFDAAQGRLWVVCRHCTRWNLVPFDTRLESIDAAERAFRDTTTRFSTDNIGLARLREGLELVRIGPALRPEFAAWRYGDSFGRRRRRSIMLTAAGTTAVLGVAGGMAFAGASAVFMLQLPNMWNLFYAHRRVALRIPRHDASPIEMTAMHLAGATIRADEASGWALSTPAIARTRGGFRHLGKQEEHVLRGSEAHLALRSILGQINLFSGSQRNVRDAIARVEQAPDPDRLLMESRAIPNARWARKGIGDLPASVRLALEMSLNEEGERVALHGELKLLEWQWREADKLAKISDALEIAYGIGTRNT